MKNGKGSPWRSFVRALGLPEQAMLSQCHIDLLGRHELFLENAKGILEYEREYIRVVITEGKLLITGEELRVDMFMEKTIIIRGKIKSIAFE